MAVNGTSTTSSGDRRVWMVALSLLVLFGAALFLRTYWNVDAAIAQDSNGMSHFVLSSGSDPYYEKRTIDAIQANGFHQPIADPLLNYPYGSNDPNPPLYDWTVATAGQLLSPLFHAHPEMGLSQVAYATWWVTEWAPAIYGALTLFPVYFIGKSLFDRRVGLVAALLWAVSTEAVDVTGLGDSRHYAAALFFTTLAFLFYIKTVENFRGDNTWIARWSNGSSVSTGLGSLFRSRSVGFGYAFLTAMSIAAVAMMWKGFPYIIGIIGAYAVLQMVIDHWKNRDSTGLFLATTIAILVGTIIAYPYYAQAEITNFLTPVWFMVAAFVLAGLVLVPTRDLPTILVMPAAVILGILAVVVAFFVVPDVAHSLLYTTVYFKQTTLYTTIAEAHSSDFSQIAFSVGPVPFLLAIIGGIVLLFQQRKYPRRAVLFSLVWGAVALYMAHAALRFIINAIPIFAVIAAWAIVALVDWLDFSRLRKSLAANRGNFWTGFRKGVTPLQVVVVLLLVVLLVIPNVLLAADAALPPQDEFKYAQDTNNGFLKSFFQQRMGAYGQGFLPTYWLDGLTWLDQHDANTTNWADRPAFLSWWDYGHWAIAVGNHPTVADNFQNGYQYAANFILSQNETNAVQLLSARTLPMLGHDKGAALIEQAGVPAGQGGHVYDELVAWQYAPELSLDQSVKLEKLVTDATKDATHPDGVRIRYFAADIRMLPYDDPKTTSIEQSSIFYAPVTLANQNPDDYVPVMLEIAGSNGNFVNQSEFSKLQSNGIHPVQADAEKLQFTEKYYNSMFYRAYVGTPVQGPFPTDGDQELNALNTPLPAYGMEHFRLVYASQELRILEYTPGATVSGTVTEDGTPIAGATVTAYDDAGKLILSSFPEQYQAQLTAEELDVPHGSSTTDASGHYSLVAPFAMPGGNITLVTTKDGVEIMRTHVDITREEAAAQKAFTSDIAVKKGNVAGVVFVDRNNNGTYEPGNDTLLPNTNVTIGDVTVTTDANGAFNATGVHVGLQNVTIGNPTYQVTSTSAKVSVKPDATTRQNVTVELKPATVNGVLYADQNGNGAVDPGEALGDASGVSIQFQPDANVTANDAKALTVTPTDAGGNYTASLSPGSYVVTATYTAADGTKFTLDQKLVVAAGDVKTVDLALTRSS
jgi:dolichyl-diphosphooligosaccharide--protein glycosyltransferase